MTIKEYIDTNGLSLQEVVDELKPIAPYITKSLVSYFCNEKAEPPKVIKEWLAWKTVEMECEPLTPRENLVLNALRYASKERPLSRYDLRVATKMTDRQNRQAIEDLRKRGEWIVNGPEGDGYYITTNRDELNSWLAYYTARAVEINKTAHAMRSREPGQMKGVE